ncbi:MAG: tryptophan--tRNA ligase [Clostridia bacterium]
MSNKKVILTGDRPTGKLHIGHYFGSLQNRVKLQDEYDQYILISDVQALTDNFNNPEKIKQSMYQLVLDYLSCGIDPNKSTIFVQSMIPQLTELTMYFSNLVTVARLQRNPTVKTEMLQKKELFGKNGEGITYGFLGYPVSQAADIAAFDANLVPVGEDQLPMIEQTREIVRKFNQTYGNVLKEAEPLLGKVARVKGLDGNSKMGKSLGNAIYLSDSEEEITRKVMNALTDKAKLKKNDIANPQLCMVAYYHLLFSGTNCDEIFDECRKGHRGCVDCKKQLVKNICTYLAPIAEKRRYFMSQPNLVEDILIDGTKRAKVKAEETIKKVKVAMKINYFECK